jgi:hypothetical protein
MTSTARNLRIAEVEQVVRDLLKASSQFTELDDKTKSLVTLGTTMRKTIARCMAYIPGERPELGTIIAVFDVDRKNGKVTEIPAANW